MEYKSTLNLPKTDFPIKANFKEKEPELLSLWAQQDVYGNRGRRQEAAVPAGRQGGKGKYILMMGRRIQMGIFT